MTWFLRQLGKAVEETRDWPDWAKREAGLTLHLPNEAALAKLRAGKPPSRNKYGAVRTTVDGISFHSAAEARRYGVLKDLEKVGEIVGLELQPSFTFVVNGVKVCAYRADFRYVENGSVVIEDVKGRVTAGHVIKRKLMLACFGIAVRETR